jgi:hypothetical protein
MLGGWSETKTVRQKRIIHINEGFDIEPILGGYVDKFLILEGFRDLKLYLNSSFTRSTPVHLLRAVQLEFSWETGIQTSTNLTCLPVVVAEIDSCTK